MHACRKAKSLGTQPRIFLPVISIRHLASLYDRLGTDALPAPCRSVITSSSSPAFGSVIDLLAHRAKYLMEASSRKSTEGRADRLAPGRVRREPPIAPVALCCNTFRLQNVWQYYDASTLLPISRMEWVRRVCVDWQGDHEGVLPSVSQLAILADVGHTTAQNGRFLAERVKKTPFSLT